MITKSPGPMVPWELECQQDKCTAPECDCPAAGASRTKTKRGGMSPVTPSERMWNEGKPLA